MRKWLGMILGWLACLTFGVTAVASILAVDAPKNMAEFLARSFAVVMVLIFCLMVYILFKD